MLIIQGAWFDVYETLAVFIILFFIAQDADKSYHFHLAQYKDNVAWFYRMKLTSLL